MQVYLVDYVEGRQYNYDDIYGFNSFASLDLSSSLGQVYMPPFYEVIVKSTRLSLGKTIASRTASPPPVCGDVRDQILQEYYVKPRASFFPLCSDFTSSVNWQYPGGFSFLTLAPTQSTGYGQWAVIQPYMANNLRSVFNDLGNLPDITSGYRNPAKEASVGRYFPNSRHMAGDAVDLRTEGSQETYSRQQAAGHQEHGCVEPVNPKDGPQMDYNHTHIDWRTFGSGKFPGPPSCPGGW